MRIPWRAHLGSSHAEFDGKVHDPPCAVRDELESVFGTWNLLLYQEIFSGKSSETPAFSWWHYPSFQPTFMSFQLHNCSDGETDAEQPRGRALRAAERGVPRARDKFGPEGALQAHGTLHRRE